MKFVSLAHGNGGRLMRELIAEVFVARLGNPDLDTQVDSVAVDCGVAGGEMVLTTDGFTVMPLEFPGGNIGSLAVNGTINDLAVAGAVPEYMCLGAIIEEGLEIALLHRLVDSIGSAAVESGIRIVCGDTKVVPRGEGSGVYFTTTGIGFRPYSLRPGMSRIRDGDAILVSGPVGDHGIAVLLAREQFGLSGHVTSDCRSVLPLTRALIPFENLRFMRDPTRGGLATVLHEIRAATGFGIALQDTSVPVRDPVRSVCDMLGYDPLYLACEGQVVAVVAHQEASAALHAWRSQQAGREAAIIGRVTSHHDRVILDTAAGGQRVMEELEEDPLPRIC